MSLTNIIISIVLLGITIIGDFALKKASDMPGLSGWKLVIVGSILYAISAFGWFYTYKTTQFFTLGVFYSLGHFMLTVLIALFIFKERVSGWEVLGLVLAVASLGILLKGGTTV